ncbi:hypothetical protein EPUS_05649 [Endocarpon pusillum Z07020]|uniref:Uncharacterized protein n=1 Tax=Endocarpon pusillum (strain Z07020 / HMAS-L-300199) TaxID=1263415 RepID=U1HEM1_ENDPU|nr:uncharacterized protein EPUS_05649 [Endocarpon pusillum Z07020]ERF68510.1 hypothetical protein EPUS_05649 [Endocarpon pusillum Z07020]
MKSSFSSTSPFAYQIPPSSKSHRSGEHSRSKPLPESGDVSERIVKKPPRSSDEGRSKGKSSRSQSSSASTLFSQPNVTLEDIPISNLPSSLSTTRPAMVTPRPAPQFVERSVAQRAPTLQPTVEEDVQSVTSTPRMAKKLPQKSMDAVQPPPPPSTPELTTAPLPVQKQDFPKPQLVPVEPTVGIGEAQHPSTSPSSTDGSPAQAKSKPRRSLDDSMTRHSVAAPGNSAVTSAAIRISPPQSPQLHVYNPHNYHQGYMSAAPLPDSKRSSPAPQPPQSMPPINYGYLPMMGGGPQPSVYANPYYGMPFSPPAEPSLQNNDSPRSPPPAQDEHEQLLEKVAGVLPDINRLLNNYKERQGRLSARELLEKQAHLSHSEQLNKVGIELEATKKEYEKVIQELVSERGKLERELTVLRPRVTELESAEAEKKALKAELEAMKVSKKELAEALDGTRRAKEEMQTTKLANDTENEALRKALHDERELRQRYVADVKVQAQDQIALKQREFSKIVDDHKLNYSKAQMELTSLISKHSIQKADLDAARSSEADHKTKLSLKSKEFDDALLRHRQEIETIKKKHEQDRGKMAQGAEERVAQICQEHSIKEKEWKQEFHSISAELESHKLESQRLRAELETLEKSKNEEKLHKTAELVESLALWRTKSDELQKQNQNLDRLLQSLGCAARN